MIDPWKKGNRTSLKKFKTDNMDSGYKFYVQILEKMGFYPKLVAKYNCVFGTNCIPKRFVFRRIKSKDIIVFYECINTFKYKVAHGNDVYYSPEFGSPYFFMRQDFTETMENMCSGLPLNASRRPRLKKMFRLALKYKSYIAMR